MSDFEAITAHTDDHADDIDWVTRPDVPTPIEIVEPDPAWPAHYDELADRITAALGPAVLGLQHVGSTSVPELPAKPIIDIDLTVADSTDEAAYVPLLVAVGFVLRLREPGWHQHRLLVDSAPASAHLHVWSPDCPEVVRHRLFRDWLREHPEDRARYAAAKREAVSSNVGGSMMDYNRRKQPVVREILDRMFQARGML